MTITNQNKLSQWIAKNLVKPIHSSTVSDRRLKKLSRHLGELIVDHSPLIGLDVGSGSGEIAKHLQDHHPDLEMFGVDVLVRGNTAIKVIEFDGKKLPFADKSYDFVMLIDVLHHTHDPLILINESIRVSRQFILIKDHLCNSLWDRIRLSFMDWVGNRGYDVNLPYNYLSEKQWKSLYQKTGLICDKKIDKLELYPQPFSLIFDSSLHFIAKLVYV